MAYRITLSKLKTLINEMLQIDRFSISEDLTYLAHTYWDETPNPMPWHVVKELTGLTREQVEKYLLEFGDETQCVKSKGDRGIFLDDPMIWNK